MDKLLVNLLPICRAETDEESSQEVSLTASSVTEPTSDGLQEVAHPDADVNWQSNHEDDGTTSRLRAAWHESSESSLARVV